MITYQYEEYKPVRQIWTWLAILLLADITLSWGMVTHMAIPDVPRHWDLGVVLDTPGQSAYVTMPPPSAGKAVPPQIELRPNLSTDDREPNAG